MSENNYKVYDKYIEAFDFKVMILEIPEDEVEDRLTYLTRESGQITRSYYEDFVIAKCVVNINHFIAHINPRISSIDELINFRKLLVDAVYEYNPFLNPESLYINKNNVIKIMRSTELKEGERKLIDNKVWSTSYYEEIAAMYGLGSDKQQEETPSEEEQQPEKTIKETGKVKDIDQLSYKIKKVWWSRIGKYINIKEFKPSDAESIIKKTDYKDSITFKTYIVSVCVDGWEDLFQMLDEMGITGRASAPILVEEVYKLCLICNDLLTVHNAVSLGCIKEPKKGKNPLKPKAAGTSMVNQVKGKQKKKLFKDVPKDKLLSLFDDMTKSLIGQDEAVKCITESLKRASVGLKDPKKPIGSFLFAGRTGCGKTECSKILAQKLMGDDPSIMVIDCSEYTADHEYSKLIGSPSGYIGHEQGGALTNFITENPFSVVVFDEVEKASAKVHDLLLQILDEGRLTDGKGQPATFKDAIVIMTSNVGVKEIDDIKKTVGFGDVAKITDEKKDHALTQALKKKFKPEFLNRIDSVVNFKTLTKNDYMKIIALELNKLNDNLKNNDTEYNKVTIKFNESVKGLIYKNGINEEFGARPLKRCIERLISTPLATEMLTFDEESKDYTVTVNSVKGMLRFKIELPTQEGNKKADPPFYLSEEYNALTLMNS